ncbi:hypothetical protein [Myxococcus sp. CA039A]|uniref:hypothetical protein n=1 Tax=Myxococcus sp. CA039A TaxID=2741737 RepID=UPI00157A6DAD|nr:hypothetical protein [Myxococcus sp. CA039A]NTX57953.1 hypothetical protein [Myxococcus sp. CA039A]
MSCAAGELKDLCARLRALEAWWRAAEVDTIRACMDEADVLPERQSAVQEELRLAEDKLALLKPDETRATQDRWRELQRTVTASRKSLGDLATASNALYAALGIELWWARTAHWKNGVARINAEQD